MDKRFEYAAQLAAVSILAVGCYLVLQPFLTAVLLGAVICMSTWPFYRRVLRWLNGRQTLAALLMTLLLVLVVILPFAVAAYRMAGNVQAFYDAIKRAVEAGPRQPPEWLTGIPLVGDLVNEYWTEITTSREEMLAMARRLLDPLRKFLLAGGLLIGRGVGEMSLAALVSFLFYRHGVAVLRFISGAMERVVGIHAQSINTIIVSTVRAVMFGILGTALAQGLVATIGFVIVGVPAPLLLGAATFMLSLVPVGPPIIWGAVAIWLFYRGEAGWGVFMLVWGFFGISGVDNVVKPLVISHTARLPFILGLFGVLGGVLAFGFVGIFIGPVLLAVALSLAREWAARDNIV